MKISPGPGHLLIQLLQVKRITPQGIHLPGGEAPPLGIARVLALGPNTFFENGTPRPHPCDIVEGDLILFSAGTSPIWPTEATKVVSSKTGTVGLKEALIDEAYVLGTVEIERAEEDLFEEGFSEIEDAPPPMRLVDGDGDPVGEDSTESDDDNEAVDS